MGILEDIARRRAVLNKNLDFSLPDIPPAPPPKAVASFGDRVTDFGADVLKVPGNVASAVAGLANLPFAPLNVAPFEFLEKGAKNVNAAIGNKIYSDARKQEEADVQNAFQSKQNAGLWEQLKAGAGAAIDNPAVAVGHVPTILAEMLAGSKGARYLMPNAEALTAGAAGEGAVSAGHISANIGEETDDEFRRLMALPAGAVTAAIPMVGGSLLSKMAQQSGVVGRVGRAMDEAVDPETLLAGGARAGTGSLLQRMAAGGFREGVLEEMPQSFSESVMSNVATDKPWMQGAGVDAGYGGVLGAGFGTGFNIRGPQQAVPAETTPGQEAQPAQAQAGRQVIDTPETDHFTKLTDEQVVRLRNAVVQRQQPGVEMHPNDVAIVELMDRELARRDAVFQRDQKFSQPADTTLPEMQQRSPEELTMMAREAEVSRLQQAAAKATADGNTELAKSLNATAKALGKKIKPVAPMEPAAEETIDPAGEWGSFSMFTDEELVSAYNTVSQQAQDFRQQFGMDRPGDVAQLDAMGAELSSRQELFKLMQKATSGKEAPVPEDQPNLSNYAPGGVNYKAPSGVETFDDAVVENTGEPSLTPVGPVLGAKGLLATAQEKFTAGLRAKKEGKKEQSKALFAEAARLRKEAEAVLSGKPPAAKATKPEKAAQPDKPLTPKQVRKEVNNLVSSGVINKQQSLDLGTLALKDPVAAMTEIARIKTEYETTPAMPLPESANQPATLQGAPVVAQPEQMVTQEGEARGAENAGAVVVGESGSMTVPPELVGNQRAVYTAMATAVLNNEFDTYLQSDGSLNYTKIAEDAGASTRQAGYAAVKQTVDKILKGYGLDKATAKQMLKAKNVASRKVEAHDEDKLGLSPAEQNSVVEVEDLFGENQSMGLIEGVSGSQSAIGVEDKEATTMTLARPDPVAEKRVAEAAAVRAAALKEVLSHPEAASAIEDFEDFAKVPAAALSEADASDMLLSYLEYKETGNEELLLADWKDIAQRYDQSLDGTATGEQQLPGSQPERAGQGEDTAAKPAALPSNSPAPKVKVKKTRTVAAPAAQLDALSKAPEDWTPTEVLNRLGILRKDKQHKAIAESYLAQARAGEDVLVEAAKWVTAVNPELAPVPDNGTKYSLSEAPQGQDAAKLEAKLKKFFSSPYFFNRAVQVVQDENDPRLPASERQSLSKTPGKAQGFFADGKVWMIANNVAEGKELAVLLHEVGVHMGMKNLLGKQNYGKLITQLQTWVLDGTGAEGVLAKRAMSRVKNAETLLGDAAVAAAEEEFGAALPKEVADNIRKAAKLSKSEREEELLAYFVEEAVNTGMDPTAVKGAGKLQQWFRTLWAAVKVAVRKLGMNPDALTAQHVIDLAYGAARMELNAAWHGTAADFRRFDHLFMGSGEGAQAFGWGTYLAQAVGIGKGYWVADIARKAKGKRPDNYQELVDESNIAAEDVDYLEQAGDAFYSSALGREFAGANAAVAALDEAIARNKARTEEHRNNRGKPGFNDNAIDGNIRFLTTDQLPRYASERSQVVSRAPYAVRLEAAKARLAAAEKARNAALKTVQPEGNLMRVDTSIQDEELLDWDKPLSEQSELVKKALERAWKEKIPPANAAYGPNLWTSLKFTSPDNTGESLYRGLTEAFDYDKKDASEYLDSIGIKGIKFLDANSRNMKDVAALEKRLAAVKADLAAIEVRGPTNQMFYQDVAELEKEIKFREAELADAKRKGAPTRNIVVFNDKNIQRIFSEKGANPESRMFSIAPSANPKVAAAMADIGASFAAVSPKLLTNFQLHDQHKGDMPTLTTHMALLDQMSVRQQQIVNASHPIMEKWSTFMSKSKEAALRMHKVMQDATLRGMHPDEALGTGGNDHLTAKDQAAYDELKSRYMAMPQTAKDIYQEAKKMLADNWALRREIYNEMVRDAYKDDLTAAAKDPKELARLNKLIDKNIKDRDAQIKELKGPYFPLMRFGDYLVIAESPELTAKRASLATASGAAHKTLLGEIAVMERNPKHYQASAFERASEMQAEHARLTAAGMNAHPTKARDFSKQTQSMSFATMEMLNKKLSKEFDSGTTAKLRQIVTGLALASTPEHSALQRQIKRKGVSGASLDMLRAFAESVESDSFHLSRMEKMKDISSNLHAMGIEASKAGGPLVDVYNNVVRRMEMDFTSERSPKAAALSRLSSFFHLGVAPSYLLTNMTQPFMITSGHLAGRFGMRRSMGALSSAWMDATKIIKAGKKGNWFADVDFAATLQGNELVLATYLYDLGKLSIANNVDTEMYTGGLNPKLVKLAKTFNWATHHIELTNRLTTALATYRLELPKAGHAAAMDKAREAIELTQLTYDDTNAAYFMKANHLGGWNRIPMQFKKYQQGMVYLLFREGKRALAGDKDALKALGYLLTTQLAFAGARGLPIAFPIFLLAGLLGDDDDEEGDLETKARNYLTDSIGAEPARALWSGLPTLFGANLSNNLGMGNLLNPAGMLQARDLASAATGKEAIKEIGFNVAGAPIGMLSKFADSMILAGHGDIGKAFEQSMPKFIASPLKAARYGTEGLTTRRGNEAVAAEDFDAWDLTLKSLGFSPVTESEHYAGKQAVEDRNAAKKDRRNRLITQAANGRDVQEQIDAFNADHPEKVDRITRATILKSKAQKKRVKNPMDDELARFALVEDE